MFNAGNTSGHSLAEQQTGMAEKLRGYVAWADQEPRLIGIFPWHLEDFSYEKSCENQQHCLGATHFPEAMEVVKEIGRNISKDLSHTGRHKHDKPTLDRKTDDELVTIITVTPPSSPPPPSLPDMLRIDWRQLPDIHAQGPEKQGFQASRRERCCHSHGAATLSNIWNIPIHS